MKDISINKKSYPPNRLVWLYVITVFLIFYYVPHNYMENYKTINYIVLFLAFVLGCLNKPCGFPIMLVAYASCFPQVNRESDDTMNSLIFGQKNSYITYAIVLYFIIKVIKNKRLIKSIKWEYLLYLILGVLYSVIYYSKFEFSLTLNTFIYLFLFYIIVNEEKIEQRQVYVILDCCFYATFVYVLLQMFYDYSPYSFVKVNTGNIMDLFRASGLFRHPLYLSYFAILYSVYFAYRLLRDNNRYILINLLLATIVLLFTASRTSVIVSCIIWIFVLFSMNLNRNVSFFFLLIIITICFGGEYLAYSFDTLVSRVNDIDSSSITNRSGTYGATWNCFLDNPLGVGYKSAARLIYSKYREPGMINDFWTIDNQYLSYICYYGILAIIPLFALFTLFKTAYRNCNGIFVILYLIIFLLCFSFNVMNSPYAMMLLASFMAMFNRFSLDKKDVTSHI